jgi:Tfp pilus assembly protein PilW
MRTSLVRRLARRRAFTLVELMVSLVAGLIVTIAVVGLARTATTTFYEEARLSTTEAAARSAAERLRQDLSRVAFMSTGNIQLARNDSPSVPFGQKISHPPPPGTPSRYGATTANVQGLKITSGGSLLTGADGPLGLSTVNLLSPDTIQMTGNYTTNDSYRGRMTGSGNDSIVLKVVDDPAVARLVAGADPNAAVRNVFTPGSPSGSVPPFLARVVDPRGCSHFVVLSAITATATGATITFAASTDGKSPVLKPTEDQSTCGASEQEEVTINPIQTVRWYIGQTNVALQADPNVDPVGNKFDLYREIRDANGAVVAPLGAPQVIAEYAVDMKFGITVDNPAPAFPPPSNHQVFDMDTNSALVQTWTGDASGTAAGGVGPQRVRSVRFRLATRAAIPDRKAAIPSVLPTPAQYMTRYCMEKTTPCTKFARVRTIMSEVALINQAGMTY